MFKPKDRDFKMRPEPKEEPKVGPIVSTDWIVVVLADAGNGWVQAEAFGRREQDYAKGFAKQEWLEKIEFKTEIELGKFFIACCDGAFDFKTNAAYLLAVAQIESGLKNVYAANSAAFGPFQILPDTWEQYRVDPKIRFTRVQRFDPYLQPIVAAKIAAEGTAELAKILPNNVNPTPPELYFAHLFGVRGATVILDSETRKGDIKQALQKVYAADPDPAARAQKIIDANKELLAPAGQPLSVADILKAVGEKLKKALEEAVPDKVAEAANAETNREFVAMAQSGDTTYWVFDSFDDETGGQELVKQVGDEVPKVLASDTKLMPLKRGIVPDDITDKLNKSAEDGVPPDGPNGPAPGPGADIASLVLAAAEAANDVLETKNVAGTKNGRLACAWAVNHIVRAAIGRPIGGGLSTSEMCKVLKSPQSQHTEIDANQVIGGTIIISPTQDGNVGHVGIVGDVAANVDATVVYSNSSSKGIFSDFYTVGTWKAKFDGKLPVLFFKLNT